MVRRLFGRRRDVKIVTFPPVILSAVERSRRISKYFFASPARKRKKRGNIQRSFAGPRMQNRTLGIGANVEAAVSSRSRETRLRFAGDDTRPYRNANPRRLLGLVLLALARDFLSRHETNRHLVQALHVDFQYGGAKRPLLQLAEDHHRERMAAQRPGEFSLLGESESTHHP